MMKKVRMQVLREIAEEHGLHPCRIRGTEVVNIRKRDDPKYEDISWADFESLLGARGLAVYKAENSDFLKIMKDE